MHSTAKLSPLQILKKFNFFSGKTIYLSKKTQILDVLRDLTISVHLCGKFTVSWLKNFTFRIVISVIILPDTDIRTSSLGKLAFEPEIFPILSAKNFTIKV